MKVVLLDTGIGNIQSVANVLEHIGANFEISTSADVLLAADKVIFPGVGTYGAAMKKIANRGLNEPLNQALLKDKKPCLGICVGMQVLSERGFEFGEYQGLKVVPGTVRKIEGQDLRLPHVGWNNVTVSPKSKLFKGIPEDGAFYFLHSYHFETDPQFVAGKVTYGMELTAAIEKENIFGVQFHPEKSQDYGIQLFKNFMEL